MHQWSSLFSFWLGTRMQSDSYACANMFRGHPSQRETVPPCNSERFLHKSVWWPVIHLTWHLWRTGFETFVRMCTNHEKLCSTQSWPVCLQQQAPTAPVTLVTTPLMHSILINMPTQIFFKLSQGGKLCNEETHTTATQNHCKTRLQDITQIHLYKIKNQVIRLMQSPTFCKPYFHSLFKIFCWFYRLNTKTKIFNTVWE